jgi:hypothetical protein
MHAFSPSGQELLLFDAFGLTRFVLPTKPKAPMKSKRIDKVVGVKLRASGDTALAYNVRANRISSFSISDLKPLKHGFSDYGTSAPHEDGAHVLTTDWDGSLKLQTFAGALVDFIPLRDVASLGVLDVGPRLSPLSPNVPSEVWTGLGGSFAVYQGRRGMLVGGVIPSGTTTATACWELDVGQPEGVLHVAPGEASTFVRVFSPSEGQTRCARVTQRGVEAQTVKSDGPATFDGERIVYERAGTIFRTTFDGKTEELAKVEDEGPGELIARGDAVYRVSADRERVRDIASGVESPRKLPEGEARLELLSRVRSANERSRRSNVVIELADLAPQGGRLDIDLAWSFGDCGLLGVISIGNVIGEFVADPGERWALRALRGQTVWCPPGRERALEAIAHMEATGLSLLNGLPYLMLVDGLAPPPLFLGVPAADGPSPSQAMAKVVLAAILHVAKTGTQVGMAEAARSDIAPEDLVRHLNAAFFDAASEQMHTRRFQPVLHLAMAALGRDAKAVLREWTELHPCAFVRSNPHVADEALKLYAALYPDANP